MENYKDFQSPCPHCFEQLRLRNVPLNPRLRGKCPKCGEHYVLVANWILYRRRSEGSWLRRKLQNAVQFSKLSDTNDVVYSELFIAFEVLLRMLYECTGEQAENKSLRMMVDDLRNRKVISHTQHRQIQDAITDRNRLFHGDSVDLNILPLKTLSALVEDLRWYFLPSY